MQGRHPFVAELIMWERDRPMTAQDAIIPRVRPADRGLRWRRSCLFPRVAPIAFHLSPRYSLTAPVIAET
jgi:hypothetical protein